MPLNALGLPTRPIRTLIFAAAMLLAHAVVIGLWWIWNEPGAYLWTRHAPAEVAGQVRAAGRAVFWLRWPVWVLALDGAVAATLLLRASRGRAAGVAAGAALACALLLDAWGDRALADKYFTLFRLQDRPEPLLLQPLREAGPAVGPHLVGHVARRDAELRGYAIAALAELEYAPAVPILARIMTDTSESPYLRADALEALRQIGSGEARAAVARFEASLQAHGRDSVLVSHMGRLRSH